MRRIVLPLLVFAWACALRLVFFSGFVLCDDIQEYATCVHVLTHGPMLTDQFHLRFGGWLFNVVAFRLVGVSEFGFFLPSVLMSASLGIVAYAILLRWGYGVVAAFAAALMLTAAPFEVLIGTVRANDLFLAWLVALALWALVMLRERPVAEGVIVAFLGWLGFYVKLWVVYFLPALGVFYLLEIRRGGRWRGAVTFALASVGLHAATCLIWKRLTDDWVPFVHQHAATYPIARADLPRFLRVYPDMLLRGSEFGTTLFGSIPYLVGIGLLLKLAGSLVPRRFAIGWRMDARDWALFGCWGSFFLLLEFLPNSFAFDRYYSAPRIFRYLAPMSFPLTLHLAKMMLDLLPRRATSLAVVLLVALTGWNVRETAAAAAPSRAYRAALKALIAEVRERRPPMLVAEAWLSYFLSNVYLKDVAQQVVIVPMFKLNAAREYEAWLGRQQASFRPGTLLLTGIGSCVHYGAHGDGFRLALFEHELDPAWKVVKELPALDYLPVHEPVRLWQLTERAAAPPTTAAARVDGDQVPEELFTSGMARFDGGRCLDAQPYFEALLARYPAAARAEDAMYFLAICRFRDQHWRETIASFEELVRKYPNGHWVPGAYYHIGVSYAALGDTERAREAFETVRDRFSREETVARLARERLAEMNTESSLLERLEKRLGFHGFQ